jgi:HlyD family secretion protein
MAKTSCVHTNMKKPIFWLCILLATSCSEEYPRTVGILEWDRIELVAESNEPIVEIRAQDGDLLQAGQTILQLDKQRIQAQCDEARASLEQTKAQLRAAISQQERTDAELQRISALVQKNLSTAEALDLARTQRAQAHAQRDAAQAAIDQNNARSRLLEITLERLTLRAPQNGRLDVINFELGEQPNAGDVVAVMLAGRTPYARVYVAEPLLAHISIGTKARIFIDGIKEPFAGHVRTLSHDPAFTPFYSLTENDRSHLSYLAEVEMESEQTHALAAGIPLEVEFLISNEKYHTP